MMTDGTTDLEGRVTIRAAAPGPVDMPVTAAAGVHAGRLDAIVLVDFRGQKPDQYSENCKQEKDHKHHRCVWPE
jgi:hypothetical protein